ncbi:hypothetical protein M427DRAFT_452850 [Gonapodya prolifera JEL478]|uniref:NADH dehydrogenase [ubiquinone] 1 alpha subcomplex subunit n=1 Tax=Gonapodya prolifera (strain JEL478) TaxID=1344416 RepID=A0A139ASL6_GONPJ|nr:hypothetical protein M427DRAFT_452850 [Gonapodya prolifera JEL478]|eukprot:KXS19543.1 hypothetical protein M427DRAFT_452850 [Gonapodya prolifera JEL478]
MSRWGDLNNIITRTISGVLSNGWRRTLKQVYTIHDPKIGTLIGQDHLGNQYYENRNEAWGRHRWVEYERWSWPGEADRVPAEWHGWLSKSHDDPAHALKKAK